MTPTDLYILFYRFLSDYLKEGDKKTTNGPSQKNILDQVRKCGSVTSVLESVKDAENSSWDETRIVDQHFYWSTYLRFQCDLISNI